MMTVTRRRHCALARARATLKGAIRRGKGRGREGSGARSAPGSAPSPPPRGCMPADERGALPQAAPGPTDPAPAPHARAQARRRRLGRARAHSSERSLPGCHSDSDSDPRRRKPPGPLQVGSTRIRGFRPSPARAARRQGRNDCASESAYLSNPTSPAGPPQYLAGNDLRIPGSARVRWPRPRIRVQSPAVTITGGL